ncbi:MAG: hypothetical protein BRC49_03170 [Cyanobacteria bacterium SW_10_48_33]|nr:MAG: hypothetical protein BRC49_03170 [Cyanobacteria bacterium SW_10_48_33]
MELADARSLSPQTQQALRQRAVAAVVEQVRTQQQVARELGVARATVKCWVQRDRARGEPALAARKQGRPRSFETMLQSSYSCPTRCGRWKRSLSSSGSSVGSSYPGRR